MAAKFLTREQARKALGDMPERTFARWCAKGLPSKGSGKKVTFPWPEIFRWLTEQVERRAREQARAPTTLDEARQREAAAKAELAELELAERRRELMTVAEYDRVTGNAFQRVRAQLLTLPTKMAPEVVGITSVAEALEKIEPMINDVLTELHEAKDVPTPSVEADDEQAEEEEAEVE